MGVREVMSRRAGLAATVHHSDDPLTHVGVESAGTGKQGDGVRRDLTAVVAGAPSVLVIGI